MNDPAPGYHARALRAIGQDLADLFPEKLTIELCGDSFVASGTCAKSRAQECAATGRAGLKAWGRKWLKRIVGTSRPGEPELEFAPFSRTYSFHDIERLDSLGSRQRNRTGMPDIYTLAERLRTIGRVIDDHNGRAVRISKDLQQVVFEYRDPSGALRKEVLNNTELYQLQQRHSAERSGASSG